MFSGLGVVNPLRTSCRHTLVVPYPSCHVNPVLRITGHSRGPRSHHHPPQSITSEPHYTYSRQRESSTPSTINHLYQRNEATKISNECLTPISSTSHLSTTSWLSNRHEQKYQLHPWWSYISFQSYSSIWYKRRFPVIKWSILWKIYLLIRWSYFRLLGYTIIKITIGSVIKCSPIYTNLVQHHSLPLSTYDSLSVPPLSHHLLIQDICNTWSALVLFPLFLNAAIAIVALFGKATAKPEWSYYDSPLMVLPHFSHKGYVIIHL